MRKFESSQKDESRAQSADSSKAYRKRRAYYCLEYYALEAVHLYFTIAVVISEHFINH